MVATLVCFEFIVEIGLFMMLFALWCLDLLVVLFVIV